MPLDAANPFANPFASPSILPFGLPDWTVISDTDYQPAIEAGMAEQLAELDAIASDSAPADASRTSHAPDHRENGRAPAGETVYTTLAADTNKK